jgi:glycosyltransferase involved in cell wall biosynthesis
MGKLLMKKNNPMLSIIVPMYNAQDTISECIDSILDQKFKEYELILVDDGSTDDTLKICKTYAEKDQRIIIVPLEKNIL